MPTTKTQRRRNARLYTGDPSKARFIVSGPGMGLPAGTDVTDKFRDSPNLRGLVRRGVLKGVPMVDHRLISPKGVSDGAVPDRIGVGPAADPLLAKKVAEEEAALAPVSAPVELPAPAGPSKEALDNLEKLNGRHGESTIKSALEAAGITVSEDMTKDDMLDLAHNAG